MDEQIIFIIGISVGILSIGLVIFIVLLIHFTRRLHGIQRPQRTPPAVPPAEYYFPHSHSAFRTIPSLGVTEYIPEDIADDPSAAEEVRNFPRCIDEEYDNRWDTQSGSYDNDFGNELGPIKNDQSASGSVGLSSNRSPDGNLPASLSTRAHEVLVGKENLVYGPPVIDPRPGAPDTPMINVVGDVVVHRPGYPTTQHSDNFSEDTEGYMRPRPIVREA